MGSVMDIITLDFETYFDKDFTLRKMTTESYIRDPRFEVHGCAIRPVDGCTQWFRGNDLEQVFAITDWSKVACLSHHAQFDGLILSHHYGIKPAMWLDTLSMARVMIGNHLSVGLGSLAEHFGLGAKDVPYKLFEGRHWHEITSDVQAWIARGSCQDVELTWRLFCELAKGFPQEEYQLISDTVKMFTEPALIGNRDKLGEIWQQEAKERADLLTKLSVQGADLRSNESFADLLRAEGIEPELKGGKNGDIYAFAATDDFMRDLLEDDSPRIQALAQARLAEKSNIIQTRSERLGWMATRGPMCVYLAYGAAHTTRWGGGDKLNWQNFPRESALGSAIEAPPGHLVVVNDASQIECRILNQVAGQTDVIERFRNHEDPYIAIASIFYGFEVTKEHPKERGTGKQLELSCGYGAGGPTIVRTAKRGTYGPPVELTDAQGMQARDLYRLTHPYVQRLWWQADDVLKKLNAGLEFDWHCLHVKDKRIYLPNGLPLIYETLEWHIADNGDQFWRLKTRKGWVKLYGSKLVENLIQALARLHVSQAWYRCSKAGIRMVSMEHDKLIAIVAEHEADAALAYMKQEMCRAPDWLPGIPLDSEGFVSRTLAKEKT
jgi:DNA polymerase family A